MYFPASQGAMDGLGFICDSLKAREKIDHHGNIYLSIKLQNQLVVNMFTY